MAQTTSPPISPPKVGILAGAIAAFEGAGEMETVAGREVVAVEGRTDPTPPETVGEGVDEAVAELGLLPPTLTMKGRSGPVISTSFPLSSVHKPKSRKKGPAGGLRALVENVRSYSPIWGASLSSAYTARSVPLVVEVTKTSSSTYSNYRRPGCPGW